MKQYFNGIFSRQTSGTAGTIPRDHDHDQERKRAGTIVHSQHQEVEEIWEQSSTGRFAGNHTSARTTNSRQYDNHYPTSRTERKHTLFIESEPEEHLSIPRTASHATGDRNPDPARILQAALVDAVGGGGENRTTRDRSRSRGGGRPGERDDRAPSDFERANYHERSGPGNASRCHPPGLQTNPLGIGGHLPLLNTSASSASHQRFDDKGQIVLDKSYRDDYEALNGNEYGIPSDRVRQPAASQGGHDRLAFPFAPLPEIPKKSPGKVQIHLPGSRSARTTQRHLDGYAINPKAGPSKRKRESSGSPIDLSSDHDVCESDRPDPIETDEEEWQDDGVGWIERSRPHKHKAEERIAAKVALGFTLESGVRKGGTRVRDTRSGSTSKSFQEYALGTGLAVPLREPAQSWEAFEQEATMSKNHKAKRIQASGSNGKAKGAACPFTPGRSNISGSEKPARKADTGSSKLSQGDTMPTRSSRGPNMTAGTESKFFAARGNATSVVHGSAGVPSTIFRMDPISSGAKSHRNTRSMARSPPASASAAHPHSPASSIVDLDPEETSSPQSSAPANRQGKAYVSPQIARDDAGHHGTRAATAQYCEMLGQSRAESLAGRQGHGVLMSGAANGGRAAMQSMAKSNAGPKRSRQFDSGQRLGKGRGAESINSQDESTAGDRARSARESDGKASIQHPVPEPIHDSEAECEEPEVPENEHVRSTSLSGHDVGPTGPVVMSRAARGTSVWSKFRDVSLKQSSLLAAVAVVHHRPRLIDLDFVVDDGQASGPTDTSIVNGSQRVGQGKRKHAAERAKVNAREASVDSNLVHTSKKSKINGTKAVQSRSAAGPVSRLKSPSPKRSILSSGLRDRQRSNSSSAMLGTDDDERRRSQSPAGEHQAAVQQAMSIASTGHKVEAPHGQAGAQLPRQNVRFHDSRSRSPSIAKHNARDTLTGSVTEGNINGMKQDFVFPDDEDQADVSIPPPEEVQLVLDQGMLLPKGTRRKRRDNMELKSGLLPGQSEVRVPAAGTLTDLLQVCVLTIDNVSAVDNPRSWFVDTQAEDCLSLKANEGLDRNFAIPLGKGPVSFFSVVDEVLRLGLRVRLPKALAAKTRLPSGFDFTVDHTVVLGCSLKPPGTEGREWATNIKKQLEGLYVQVQPGPSDLLLFGTIACDALMRDPATEQVGSPDEHAVSDESSYTPDRRAKRKLRSLTKREDLSAPRHLPPRTAKSNARDAIANEPENQHEAPSTPLEHPDELVCYWPATGRVEVKITEGDLHRMNDHEYLNDTLIEFGLKYMVADCETNIEPDRVHVFNSFFYKKISDKFRSSNKTAPPHTPSEAGTWEAYDSVSKWTSKVDVFDKRYIIVPINENLHWYLAVIFNPGAVLEQARASVSLAGEAKTITLDGSSVPDSPNQIPMEPSDGVESQTVEPQHRLDDAPGDTGSHKRQSEDSIESKHYPDSGTAPPGRVATLRDEEESTDDDPIALTGERVPEPGDRESEASSHRSAPSAAPSVYGPVPIAPPPSNRQELIESTLAVRPKATPRRGKLTTRSSPAAAEPPSVRKKPTGVIPLGSCIIITLDSLGSAHKTVAACLNRWLAYEARKHVGPNQTHLDVPFDQTTPAPYKCLTTPKQSNFSDCGVYLLHYVKQLIHRESAIMDKLTAIWADPMATPDLHKPIQLLWDADGAKDGRAYWRGVIHDLRGAQRDKTELVPPVDGTQDTGVSLEILSALDAGSAPVLGDAGKELSVEPGVSLRGQPEEHDVSICVTPELAVPRGTQVQPVSNEPLLASRTVGGVAAQDPTAGPLGHPCTVTAGTGHVDLVTDEARSPGNEANFQRTSPPLPTAASQTQTHDLPTHPQGEIGAEKSFRELATASQSHDAPLAAAEHSRMPSGGSFVIPMDAAGSSSHEAGDGKEAAAMLAVISSPTFEMPKTPHVVTRVDVDMQDYDSDDPMGEQSPDGTLSASQHEGEWGNGVPPHDGRNLSDRDDMSMIPQRDGRPEKSDMDLRMYEDKAPYQPTTLGSGVISVAPEVEAEDVEMSEADDSVDVTGVLEDAHSHRMIVDTLGERCSSPSLLTSANLPGRTIPSDGVINSALFIEIAESTQKTRIRQRVSGDLHGDGEDANLGMVPSSMIDGTSRRQQSVAILEGLASPAGRMLPEQITVDLD